MYRKTSFDFSFSPILLASRLENVFCFMTLGHFIKEIKTALYNSTLVFFFSQLDLKKISLWQKSGSNMLNVTTVSRSNKVKIKQSEAIHNLPVGLMTALWQVWVWTNIESGGKQLVKLDLDTKHVYKGKLNVKLPIMQVFRVVITAEVKETAVLRRVNMYYTIVW